MKKQPLIIGSACIVGLLLVIGGVWYWKYNDMRKPAPQQPVFPTAIDIVEAETTTWFPTVRLVGTVVAKQTVSLANELSGSVTKVNFDSGSTIEPGQVLVEFDTSSEKADLAAAEASQRLSRASIAVANADIRVAESNLALATSNQKRYQEAKGSISASEVDRANAELEKAKADQQRGQSSLAKAQAELEQADARVLQINTTIAKKTLRAPFRGLASMRTVHPGQYLAEGTAIVNLMEVSDDIYLDFAVPQEYANRAVPGSTVIASSEVLGTKNVAIHVLSMDSMINPTTRNVRVRSTVADPEHKLRQGMSIDVEVPFEAPQEYVVIPTTSIRRAAFGDHVFLLTPADPIPNMPPVYTANQTMVTLGPDLGGRVIVSKGLKSGDKIAAGGSFKLRDKVLVFQAPPPGPPPGTPEPAKQAGK